MKAAEEKTMETKTNPTIRASGLRVIAREIEGLEALASSLDDAFVAVVEMLRNVRGRIVVSGMGKSGHVARKIAATLASTGSPAYFVHPAEASHGDLGMITREDAVILLSNSGETKELTDIIAYTRRFRIPLIGMVRRASSTLVEEADLALVLPDIPEASTVRAPTTSTTMMLALGDAIAVAISESRGFRTEDFQVFHPGGLLGQALVRVRNLMHTGAEVPLVTPEQSMQDVLLEMTAKRFGCAGVTGSDAALIGVITDGDLRRHMGGDLLHATAREVMTENPRVITPNALAAEALAVMNEKGITSLFAVENGQVAGILHIHDCLRMGIA